MPKVQNQRKASKRANPLSSKEPNARANQKKPVDASKKNEPKGQTGVPATGKNPAATETDPSKFHYLVLVSIRNSWGGELVSRLLSLPPTLRFDKLHKVLQVAFGWTESHQHSFDISLRDDAEAIQPPFMSLQKDPEIFDDPENVKQERDWTLADVYEKEEWKGKVNIMYEYDPGDSWEHDFCLLGRQLPGAWVHMGIPGDMKVLCLSGSGHPIGEDSGSVDGWEEIIDLFENPRKKDEDDRRGWYKKSCFNGDPKGLNPHKWDMLEVNDGLSKLDL